MKYCWYGGKTVETNTLPVIGEAAPAFSLEATYPGRVQLADYRGQNVLLAFYPLDFSGG